MTARRDASKAVRDAAASALSWYLTLPIVDVVIAIGVVAVTNVGHEAAWIAHPPTGTELSALASDIAGWAWGGFGGVLAGLVFFYALTGARDSSSRLARANRQWGVPMYWAWTTALWAVIVLAVTASFARSPIDALGWVFLALGVLVVSGLFRTTTILLMWVRLLISDDKERQAEDAFDELKRRLVFADDPEN